MKLYEGLFVLPADAPDAKATQVKGLEALIKKFGGKIAQKTEWGKRTLGYEVNKKRDAELLLIDIEMDPGKVEGFRKSLELQENLLKYTLTIKLPKEEAAPAKSSKVTGTSKSAPKKKIEATASK